MRRTRRGIPRVLLPVLVGALLVLGGPAATRAQIGSEHEQETEQLLPGGIVVGGSGGGCAPVHFGEPASDPLWIELEGAALAEVEAELPADNPYVCAAP
jgi:hypothetical protein